MADDTVVAFKHDRMSDSEYERERERIREVYGESKSDAGIRWEQALAKLFCASGWGQEEIAAREGKSQTWVQFRMRFGRFLSFPTNSTVGTNLSERHFRQLWDQTTGSDIRRFAQVAEMIQKENAPRGVNRNAMMDQIRDLYSNGKWHSTEAIANRIGKDKGEVERTLAGASSRGSRRYRIERRRRGREFQYRIYPMEKTVSSVELSEKLGPIILQLRAEGRKNMATIAIPKIAEIAAELQVMLDDWTK